MNLNTLNDDIRNQIKEYVIFKPKTREELQEAVNLWCKDKEEALNYYRHISLWNTSLITSMKSLFYFKNNFNDNISE